MDLPLLRELGGWANLEIILTYVGYANEDERDAAAEKSSLNGIKAKDKPRGLKRKLRR